MEIDNATYKLLHARALRAARKAGAPAAQLEDLAQEAVLRLWAQEETPANPGAWIRTVARNLAIDAHRGDAPEGWTELPLSAPGPRQQGWPSEFHEPSPSAQGRARKALGSLVRQLPDILSTSELRLILDAAQGMKIKDVAAKHGYTEKSARQKISVARKKVREAFPERDLEF
ncbi:RNA polymerase sigma factor [Nocardioides allogilvus]|uniref:RNA polymerase sigma factor n=1 Tax=Nocardioides allogilvus TaxID=2072017 RepID=UPI000D3179DF|nr:sigma factor [Nocardioides allogilvus]